ncbi:flagellar hook assembly protein FlgD [Sphingomonas bacterium]|uniref:flagellar hook assembly protein FlgD n=1 Tax=Sphingomonas bacterium TaxID=1895847 RepID=UPI00157583D0|nr:flagellar hook capping FlgD N-terminal domain-containing protein [Sphingomonas bacterium]
MTLATGNSYLDSLASGSGATTSSAKSAAASKTIDQSGFLKLLTAQLATQDPTAPTDNTQMVQQMATFSQVAGITEMNASLKNMASDLAAARFGDASGWIGRGALVASASAAALSTGAYAGEITLPSDAKDVTVSLLDANGQTVHTEDLGARSAGAIDWSWDGKDSAGAAVAGPLRIVVSAAAAAGSGSVTTTNAAWTEVQSVQSPASGSTRLVTGLGSFAPSDVIQLG